MIKKILPALFLIIFLVCSCQNNELEIYSIDSKIEANSLKLIVNLNSNQKDTIGFKILDPQKIFTWEVTPLFVNGNYIVDNICLPDGNILPKGEWILSINTSDGNSIEKTFLVD